MKKPLILIAAIASLLLSSCSLFNIYSTEEKELDVYAIDSLVTDTNKTLEDDGKKGSINASFVKGEKYIPYLSLEQYASLYSPYLLPNAKSEVECDAASSAWTVYVGEELYFYAMISHYTKTIMVAGSLSSAYKSESNPNDYSSLTSFTKFDDSYFTTGSSNYASYSYRNTGFKSFRKNGQYYLPLGLFDNAFSEASNIYFFYNYKNIYSSWDVSNYSLEFNTKNGKTSVDKEMESITSGTSIPSYLIDYNANMFIFVMEHFYGLKTTFGISSIKDYYIKNHLYDGLFSFNNTDRGNAYSYALACFDDNHTGLVSVNNAWGEGQTKAYGGKGVIKRQSLRKELTERRSLINHKYYLDEKLGDRGACTDVVPALVNGVSNVKTVMFSIDSFDIGSSNEIFNSDGSIKADAYNHDTFYFVLENLKTIKQYGGVENVIIDIALNGGGVVGAMAKILALLSKDNKGQVSMYDEQTGVVSSMTASVDTNEDGKYDADDCYGDDFDIYLLTSDCSFSCGNALPLYAQEMGIKTIGETTGGGECAVGIHYLPNSQYVYHSSTTHLCHNNLTKEGPFVGFEYGAKPDISLVDEEHSKAFAEFDASNNITYSIPRDLYDVSYLQGLIEQEKTK